MKPAPLLLAGSLAANAVLLACFAWRDATPAANTTLEATPRRLDEARPASANAAGDLAALAPAALRERLRALSLPPAVVDELVRARLYSTYETRRHELLADAMKSLPWWRTVNVRYDPLGVLTPEQRKELRELEAVARDTTLSLLGPAALDRDGAVALHYGFLPPDKAVLVDALERDYKNLGAQLKEDTRSIRTAADHEQEKFLETEHQRDLAAFLSPAEREAFALRVSPTAETLSRRMTAFQPTEEEYRALFAIQQAFTEKYPPGTMLPGDGGTNRPFPTRATLDVVPEVQAQIRATLGEARYADWQLSGQTFSQSLALQAPALGVSFDTVKQVATILNDTTAASWRIGDDRALTQPQKKDAIIALAASAREQVVAKLGADAADTFLTKSVYWFSAVAAGNAVKVDGNSTTTRSFSQSPAPMRAASPSLDFTPAAAPPPPPPRG